MLIWLNILSVSVYQVKVVDLLGIGGKLFCCDLKYRINFSPLPERKLMYARCDSHFLMKCYDPLLNLLEEDGKILETKEHSKDLDLIRTLYLLCVIFTTLYLLMYYIYITMNIYYSTLNWSLEVYIYLDLKEVNLGEHCLTIKIVKK